MALFVRLLYSLMGIGVFCVFHGSIVQGSFADAAKPNSPTLLVGLGARQLADFASGNQKFLQVFDIASGLGPAYNGASCGSCHNWPTIGGIGNVAVIRLGRYNEGHYELPKGGDLLHLFSIGDHACQPRIDDSSNRRALRISTPLYGAGLIEAIPDSVIRTWEDPMDRNGDGIRGRAALMKDPVTQTTRVGRFGWKAQQATLLAFAGEAFRNEIGITNDLFPKEIGMGLSPQQLSSCDKVPDPEDKPDPKTHLRGIDLVTNFMRFLAPIPPLPTNETRQRGLEIFSRTGCAACHVPELLTGPSDVPALDHKPVRAYSDFLLHDVGTGDGVEQGDAKGNEFRTSPLWGLRFRKQLMHDGSALSPSDAINQHRNEGERSRQAFQRLDAPERQALLEFLSSL